MENSGILMQRTMAKSAALNEGIAPISQELINAMRAKGRLIDVAVKESDDYR